MTVLMLAPNEALLAQNCFTASDNAKLMFQVLQQAPPPGGNPSYPYFPLTAAASMQLAKVNTDHLPGVANYYFQWANRRAGGAFTVSGREIVQKLNIQPSGGGNGRRQQRTGFSSLDQANSCTLAQTASVLNLSSKADGYAKAGGIRLVGEDAQQDAGSAGPDNICVIANDHVSPSVAGIVLDYEVQDGRTPEQTFQFLRQWADLVHTAGKKAVLLLNPLNAPSQRNTGIAASNAGRISQIFDLTTVMIWGRNREGDVGESYRNQMAMLRSGGYTPSRVIVVFELAGTSVADAQLIHAAILRDKLAGAMLWRDGAEQGGDCASPTNQKIKALLFGN